MVNPFNVIALFSSIESEVLTDLHHHEAVHSDFVKATLNGALPDPISQLLPSLAFNFDSLNFKAVMMF